MSLRLTYKIRTSSQLLAKISNNSTSPIAVHHIAEILFQEPSTGLRDVAAVPEELVEHGGWEGDEVGRVPGGEPGADGGGVALRGELDEFEVAGGGFGGGGGGVWLVHFGLEFWGS
jgi:hypothetical protein